METTRRSWVKAGLWNLIGFTMMSLVGLALTGSVSLGGQMALLNSAIGLTFYVAYERIWARVHWGRHE